MYEKWMGVISRIPLFDGIDPQQMNVIFSCLRPQINIYRKNQYIVVAGDEFKGVGFILSGCATVLKENAAGDRVIITMLKPGDMFGETAAFSKLKVWPATVSVQEESAVMILPPGKIIGNCEKMCTSHRTLILNMLNIVSDKALMLNRKVEYLAIKSMRGKISSFFLEQYRKTGSQTFVMPMKRNELADFLNVSRPSLSREMCRMRDEGIIDFHRASVKVLDIEALKNALR